MKKLFTLIVIGTTLVACDRGQPKPGDANTQQEAKNKANSDYADTESDRMLLKNIRQNAIVGEEAKDLWINVSDGNVRLKGTVGQEKDKTEIQAKVTKITGIKTIVNSLDVKSTL